MPGVSVFDTGYQVSGPMGARILDSNSSDTGYYIGGFLASEIMDPEHESTGFFMTGMNRRDVVDMKDKRRTGFFFSGRSFARIWGPCHRMPWEEG